MKKYTKLCLLILIVNINNLYSQTFDSSYKYIYEKLQFKKQIILPKEIISRSEILFDFTENFLFVTSKKIRDKETKNIIIFKFNLKNNNVDTILLEYNEKYLYNFAVSDKYILLNNYEETYIYVNSSIEDNNYKLINKKIGDRVFTFAKFIGDKIFLFGTDLRTSRGSDESFSSVFVYNLKNKEFEFEHFLKNPKALPMFWFAPRNNMDVTENNILFSEVDEYNMTIFNYNLDTLYKLNSEFEIENLVPKKYSDSIFKMVDVTTTTPKDYIDALRHFTGELNQIQRINFYNDTSIFVFRSSPLGGDYKYISLFDIWKFRNNNWSKIETFRNYPFLESNFIDKVRVLNDFQISKNMIALIHSAPYLITDNITVEELNNKLNKYYEENDPRLSIFIYDIKD